MNGPPPDLPARCRLAQMIGGALVVAVGVDAILVEVLRARRGGFAGFAPAVPVDTLRMVFIVLAIVDLALIRFLRARILAARGGQSTGGASPVTQRLLTASVVSLAMCLAIAVYGLVLFLIGGRPMDFYSFAIVAVLGLAVFFPRRSQWEEWARSSGRPG